MKHRFSNTRVVALCAAVVALATSACALTSKAAIVDVRYFSPERVKSGAKSEEPILAPAATAPNAPLQLRLGRVSSGPNLRERIAFRDTVYELGYYEDLRWTERPETYVRRGLSRSLFEVHGLHRVLSGAGPTLDVELIAFDELRLKTGRAARVQLKVILYEDNDVMFEDTLTIDRPVAGEKPQIEDVIAAMATALDAATEEITLKAQKALAARRLAMPTDLVP
jgi:cholesterol transport system auxiliary component